MKVAIIHDWLTGMRGGERCLEVFCELFPTADLFTLLHVPGSVSPVIERMPIKTSFIQHLPFSKSRYRTYLPLFPMAVENFNLKGYDLVLSCSHCVAKGVIPPPDALHISYLLTPMRYAWDMSAEYFGGAPCKAILASVHYLRMWDVTSSQRVDSFVCISEHVRNRVRKYYRRDSDVIHPPVDARRFRVRSETEDFFLIVSALVPYKRIGMAVEAFNRLRYPLKIIGTGPEERRLKSIAGPNVEFLGWQGDAAVSDLYAKCRALIFPGEEDFGIVPLEAMSCGRPVIAYGRGGVLETVIPYGSDEGKRGNPTGLFFEEASADSLCRAVERFCSIEAGYDPESIRRHALQWDREFFLEKIKKYISEKIASIC